VTELPTLELVGTICWRLLSFAKQLRDQVGERKKPLENLGKPWGNPFKSHMFPPKRGIFGDTPWYTAFSKQGHQEVQF